MSEPKWADMFGVLKGTNVTGHDEDRGPALCRCGHTLNSHEPGQCVGCTGRLCNRLTNFVAANLDEAAAQAKAGTNHEAHVGWSWLYPDRTLRCGCGADLIEETS